MRKIDSVTGRHVWILLMAGAGLWLQGCGSPVSPDVLTERYNNARTGSVEAPGINAASFGPGWGNLGQLNVGGRVYAQPLFVKGLRLQNQLRNVVFVATSANDVYAFDSRTLTQYWKKSLGPNDRTLIGLFEDGRHKSPQDSRNQGCNGISPDGIGIEATPVIDRLTKRMYVSYRTNASSDHQEQARLMVASLNLETGDFVGQQTEVCANGMCGRSYDPVWVRSRTSLLLLNGVVYLGLGSRCEDPGQPIYHGWIIALDARTLRQVGQLATTAPEIDGAGVWQASSGLVSDGENIYATTGNRRPEVDKKPIDSAEFSDRVIRIQPTVERNQDMVTGVRMKVMDWFAPYRQKWLDTFDFDLGSAGPIWIPGTQQIVSGGKQGMLYVLDRGNMGHIDTAKANDWAANKMGLIRYDSVLEDPPFAEDFSADKQIVQKFQATRQKYIIPSTPGERTASIMATGNQEEVIFAGTDGSIAVTWKVGDSNWSNRWTDGMNFDAPVRISPPSLAPTGACVVAAKTTNIQEEVFFIGNDGAVYTTWKVNNGRWTDGFDGGQGPAPITPKGWATPGACVSAASATDRQFEVFFVRASEGAVYATWKVDNGHWTDGTPGNPFPARITPNGWAAAGACLASAKPTDNQLEVFFVRPSDKAIYSTWKVDNGHWTDGNPGFPAPARITPTGWATPEACLGTGKPTDNQLEVFFVRPFDKAIYTTWKVDNGHWTDGNPGFPAPARITPTGWAAERGCVTAAKQNDNQLDIFFVRPSDNAVYVAWKVNNGHWTDGNPGFPAPARISLTHGTKPGACVSVERPIANHLEAAFSGFDGSIHLQFEDNNGPWNTDRFLPVTPALWMDNWAVWPHIHGSPVFAKFKDGTGMMYLWGEKDFLRSLPWQGKTFDAAHQTFGTDARGRILLGPNGMPGGMLAVAIDPDKPRSGVIFASISTTWPSDGPGILRAFDAVTMRELWNNWEGPGEKPNYRFSKFVPPTIADQRVFLPTASGTVLVYGKR
jgi:hypothetical protein